MANLFSRPVYEDEDITAATAQDRTDPTFAGLNDEEIRGAKTPAPGLFDTPVYEEQAAAPAAAPPKKGFFQGSILDQLIGGYHDLRATEDKFDAVDDLQQAKTLESGGDIFQGQGGMLGALSRQASPEQRAQVTQALYKDAATEIKEAQEFAAKGQERPLSPEVQEFLNDNSKKTAWEAFKAAPIKVIVELGARSGAASAVGMAGAIVGGRAGGMPGAAIGMGAVSARQEYASSVVQGLESRGVDTSSPEALAAAVGDAKLMAEVEKEATLRSISVGGFDAISMLVGGKVLTSSIKNNLAREVANVAAQAPIQGALGAAGEATGELASGQPLNPRQIGAEFAGEFVGAPVEVAAAASTGVREKIKGADEAPGPLEASATAAPVVSAIEEAQTKARADIAARGGDKLDQEVGAALAAAEVSSHKRGAHDMTAPKVREAARQLKVEQDYAAGTAQSEEDNARAQIQNEAAARYEQGIPAPAAAPLDVVKTTPEVRVQPSAVSESVTRRPHDNVADVIVQNSEKAKSADYDKALQQRDQQVATQQKFEGEPARATVAELAQPPKTLAERRKLTMGQPKLSNVAATVVNDEGGNVTTSPQVRASLPALPAPVTARTEVSPEGVPRRVSEAEMESRGPAREGLTLTKKEIPAAPVREVSPGTLQARRAEIAAQREQVDTAAAEAASSPKNDLAEPTEAQKDAGNYKMGHVKLHGMDISIETPKGGLRTFKKDGGVTASRRMRDHYGYVRRTEGADGDHVDAFIGDQPQSPNVFVIDQVKPDGSFDEHKAMIGYPDEAAAVAAYKRNYQADWKVGPVTEMPVGEFKRWAQEGDTKSPLKPDAIRQRRVAATPRRPTGGDGRLAENDGTPARRAPEEQRAKTFEALHAHQKQLEAEERSASSAVKAFDSTRSKGTASVGGLIPDEVKASPEYKAAKARYTEALGRLRDFNSTFTKQYDKELRTARDAERAAKKPAEGGSLAEAPRTLAERRNAPVQKSTKRFEVPAGTDQAPRLTKAKVDAALKPFFDEVGTEGHTVLESVTDLPEELLRRMITQHGAERMMNARGLYDRKTDTVWIFAENHRTTEKALKTAIHEIVAHQGLKKLLGKEHAALMLDVYRSAKDKKWMADFMAQHGMTDNEVNHVIAADEYIASISERQEDLSTWDKVATAVRAFLRKLGIVDKWTDADIRALLAKSYSGLARVSAHAREVKDDDSRLADGEIEPPKQAPNHPSSRLFKMNVTSQEQANYNPGFVRSRLDAIKDGGVNAIPTALSLIPRRNLPDFMPPGKMPSTKAYIRQAQRMDGRRSELLQVADETAKRWMKFTSKNKDEGRILGELMHAATLATVDPANAYKPLYTGERRGKPIPLTPEQSAIEAQRRGQYNALKRFWSGLSGEAKAIYVEVRDSYARQRDLVQQGLESRINSAEADGKVKQALIASLREKFEAGRVAGPYFPLARFGNHWASAKDGNGNVIAFSRFEKASEQRAWKMEMGRAGYAIDSGVKADDASIARSIDPGFVAKIAGMLDDIDPEMADDVWQQYLRALPEMSMRKHFIHRKGRLGFTADALRAFAFQQFHGAHQIAKLEHMAVMDSLVEQIGVEATSLQNTPDEKWAAGLRDEFGKRHKWAKAPQSSLWATRLTGLGFAFYLGATPAAALVNLTQTAIVGMPTLAARYNWLGAGTELTKSAALWAGSRGPMVNRLRGDEQKAFVEAKRVGLFEQTQAHDLAGLGEQGSLDYGSKRQKIAGLISWAFHKTEEANRQITFLASYRLARKKGRNHEEAILEAEDLTWDSHFDYANVNRPRVLQNDAMKVVFLFRQYSLNMTYRLARDFNDSIRGATPTVKKEARTRFAGILGQTFMFAGVSGLPLYWLAKTVLDNAFGDDDDPFDTDAALRSWLYEQGGQAFAQSVMDGTVGTAAHVDLSARVGLNNLWLREPMEGEDKGAFYLKELAGPVAGIGVKMFQAADLSDDLYTERALETATPKAISDTMKAMRYAREGVANKRGDVLLPPEELNTYELFTQAMGFTPSDVALQYDQNRAVKGAEQRIEQRRVHLMNQFALAMRNDDNTGTDEAITAIGAFNEKNPGRAIGVPALQSSARSRARYSMEAVNGVRVEPGLRYLHEKLRFTDPEEEENVPPNP